MTKKDKNVIKTIVVDADGDIITSSNGYLSSDNRELVRSIKREVLFRSKVQLVAPYGQKIRASLDPEDLIGNTAALFSARPGRTRLLEAPSEVWDWFRAEANTEEGPKISGKDFTFNEMTDVDVDVYLNFFGSKKKKDNTGDK